jgi:hypothetical protein
MSGLTRGKCYLEHLNLGGTAAAISRSLHNNPYNRQNREQDREMVI